jgi:hypothetical protein
MCPQKQKGGEIALDTLNRVLTARPYKRESTTSRVLYLKPLTARDDLSLRRARIYKRERAFSEPLSLEVFPHRTSLAGPADTSRHQPTPADSEVTAGFATVSDARRAGNDAEKAILSAERNSSQTRFFDCI